MRLLSGWSNPITAESSTRCARRWRKTGEIGKHVGGSGRFGLCALTDLPLSTFLHHVPAQRITNHNDQQCDQNEPFRNATPTIGRYVEKLLYPVHLPILIILTLAAILRLVIPYHHAPQNIGFATQRAPRK